MEAVCVWILVIWLLRLYLFEKKKKKEEEEEEEEDDDDDEEESFTTMTWHAWFFFFFFSYLFVVYVRLQIEGFFFLALSYV